MHKERETVEAELNQELDDPSKYIPLFKKDDQPDMFEKMKNRILFAKDETNDPQSTKIGSMIINQCQ